jgi:hypothetical protein
MVIFIGYMIGMGVDLSLAGLLWLDVQRSWNGALERKVYFNHTQYIQ